MYQSSIRKKQSSIKDNFIYFLTIRALGFEHFPPHLNMRRRHMGCDAASIYTFRNPEDQTSIFESQFLSKVSLNADVYCLGKNAANGSSPSSAF